MTHKLVRNNDVHPNTGVCLARSSLGRNDAAHLVQGLRPTDDWLKRLVDP